MAQSFLKVGYSLRVPLNLGRVHLSSLKAPALVLSPVAVPVPEV